MFRATFQAHIIPAPGTQRGPCETSCDHKGCALMRATAACKCISCGSALGYDEKYCVDLTTDAVAHEDSLIDTRSACRGAA